MEKENLESLHSGKSEETFPKEKEEIEVVVGTKEEALWQNIKDQAEQRILNSIAGIEIDRKIVELAEVKLKDLKPTKIPLN